MKIKKIQIYGLLVIILMALLSIFYINRLMVLLHVNKIKLPSSHIKTNKTHSLDLILLSNIDRLKKNQDLVDLLVQPEKQIVINDLWVDRCETTQQAFQSFSEWSKIQPGQRSFAHKDEPLNRLYISTNKEHRILGRHNSPASGVTFYDAFAYCKASGGRLPTSNEWQAIAMGKERRLYAWGNEFKLKAWPFLDPLLNNAQSCHSDNVDITMHGVSSLSSRVSEWSIGGNSKPSVNGGNGTQKPYAIYSLNYITREVKPEIRSHSIGFRCVYDRDVDETAWKEKKEIIKVEPGTYTIGLPSGSKIPHLIKSLSNTSLEYESILPKKNINRKIQYITEFEISVLQYEYFINDPFVKWKIYANKNEPKDIDYKPEDWSDQIKNKSRPVTNVKWWSAYAFAKWMGGRLPTEAEWINIASNNGKTLFPWGKDYLPIAVTVEAGVTKPIGLNEVTQDVNHYGIKHLSGNVSEWTSSIQPGPLGNRIVVKGGNYMLPGSEVSHIHYKNHFMLSQSSKNTGFRVVFE